MDGRTNGQRQWELEKRNVLVNPILESYVQFRPSHIPTEPACIRIANSQPDQQSTVSRSSSLPSSCGPDLMCHLKVVASRRSYVGGGNPELTTMSSVAPRDPREEDYYPPAPGVLEHLGDESMLGSAPPHMLSEYAQAREMSAIVSALTYVVSGGGGSAGDYCVTAAETAIGGCSLLLPPPSPSWFGPPSATSSSHFPSPWTGGDDGGGQQAQQIMMYCHGGGGGGVGGGFQMEGGGLIAGDECY